MSRALDPANYSLSEREIRNFYALCEAFEAEGNSGHYTDYNRTGGFIYEGKYVRFRTGILFFSTGWGWRLRKKPHWREVFAQRFPNTYALITEEVVSS